MLFNSLSFLKFFPIVILIYFVIPPKVRYIWLLFASYFFYMCYSPSLVFLILFTTLVSWVMARIIERSERRSVRIFALTVALVTSLGVLFFYKYFDFLSESVFSLLPLARKAVSMGGGMGAVLNAADEVAVQAFLEGKLPFYRIAEVVCETFHALSAAKEASTLDALSSFDREARAHALTRIKA